MLQSLIQLLKAEHQYQKKNLISLIFLVNTYISLLINLGTIKAIDTSCHPNQDYILQISDSLKEFESRIFHHKNKYFKIMTIQCQELGFDIHDLKGK